MYKWKKVAALSASLAGVAVPTLMAASCSSDDNEETTTPVLTDALDYLSLAEYEALNTNWNDVEALDPETNPETERDDFANTGFGIINDLTNGKSDVLNENDYNFVKTFYNQDDGFKSVITSLSKDIKNKDDFITYFNDEKNRDSKENMGFLAATTTVFNNPDEVGNENNSLLIINLQQTLVNISDGKKKIEDFTFTGADLQVPLPVQKFTVNGITKSSAFVTDRETSNAVMAEFFSYIGGILNLS